MSSYSARPDIVLPEKMTQWDYSLAPGLGRRSPVQDYISHPHTPFFMSNQQAPNNGLEKHGTKMSPASITGSNPGDGVVKSEGHVFTGLLVFSSIILLYPGNNQTRGDQIANDEIQFELVLDGVPWKISNQRNSVIDRFVYRASTHTLRPFFRIYGELDVETLFSNDGVYREELFGQTFPFWVKESFQCNAYASEGVNTWNATFAGIFANYTRHGPGQA